MEYEYSIVFNVQYNFTLVPFLGDVLARIQLLY